MESNPGQSERSKTIQFEAKIRFPIIQHQLKDKKKKKIIRKCDHLHFTLGILQIISNKTKDDPICQFFCFFFCRLNPLDEMKNKNGPTNSLQPVDLSVGSFVLFFVPWVGRFRCCFLFFFVFPLPFLLLSSFSIPLHSQFRSCSGSSLSISQEHTHQRDPGRERDPSLHPSIYTSL